MRTATWTMAAILVSGAACGDDPGASGSGSSGGADGSVRDDGTSGDGGACGTPELTSAPGDVRADRGTAELELRFEFSEPVTGIDAAPSRSGDGVIVDRVADGTTWRIVIGELFNGAEGRLEIDAVAVENDCGASLASDPAAVAYAVDAAPWEHVGPIEQGDVPARSEPWFEERTEDAGLPGSGADTRAMLVDFDGDGHDDVVTVPVAATPLRPRFWRNRAADDGFGFEEVTASSGMADARVTLLVFGDVDEDGDQDAVALTGARSPDGTNGVWTNDGEGVFAFQGARGIASSFLGRFPAPDNRPVYNEPAAATLADFDGDGDLDLYVGHWYIQVIDGDDLPRLPPPDDHLYQNDGRGLFSRVSLPEQLNPMTAPYFSRADGELIGRAAYGLSVGDYDDDGDPDLFVHNYGAGRPALGGQPFYWDHNLLWANESELGFVDVAPELGVDATLRGTVRDPRDWSTIVQEETPVRLDGETFPSPIGGNGFGCSFGDFDNDGDLDLISATIGHPDYSQSDRTLLFVNQGGGESFTEESLSRGLEYAEDELHPKWVDIDQDGLVELAMSRLRRTKMEFYLQTPEHRFERQAYETTGVDIPEPGATLWTDLDGDGDQDFFMPKGGGRVFENRAGDGRNWLRIRLEARAPRDATGARVTMRTSAGIQLREVVGGHGHYNTQPSRELHFGLGGDTGAAEVTIRWPGGETQTLGAVRANQTLVVVQGGPIRAE